MVTTRLVLGTTSVATIENISLPVTYSQSDIRNPDQRSSAYSKTGQLFGTNEINRFFENIYEVNIATQYFNPNIKELAVFYTNEQETFRGNLQLIRIHLTPDNNIAYDYTVIGELGNVFVDVADELMSVLDMSEFDHVYNRDNVVNSWSTSIIRSGSTVAYSPGDGYYYPLVNRGSVGGDESIWKVSDFMFCFYKRELFMKILANKGYTVISNFLDTEFFRRQIVYPNIDVPTLDQAQLDDRQFYIGRTSDYIFYDADGASVSPLVAANDVSLNNESAPYFDTGGHYTYPAWTCPASGTYNLVGKVNARVTITHTNPLAVDSDTILIGLAANTQIKRNAGAGYAVLNNSHNVSATTINNTTGLVIQGYDFKNNFVTHTPFDFYLSVGTGDVQLNTGDLLAFYESIGMSFVRDGSNNPIRFYDALGGLILTGSIHIKIEFIANENTSFYGLVTNKNVLPGDTISANQCLPQNIKQKDFLKSVIQEYYLQIDTDKNNPKILTIEPYIDYYGQSVDDTFHFDRNKEIVINPMSELDSKTYLFTYKSDKDYYNALYEDNHKEVFGTQRVDVETDFLKQTKTIELIFSATPNVGNDALGIAYPKIYSLDNNNQVKRITPNIRSLYAKQLTSTAPITIQEAGSSDLVINYYGYAGHVDDPFNPTIDLNFGIPKEVYYSFINAQFTTNNNYNRFQKEFIDLISNRDSKLVNAYSWLSPLKIKNFSYRKDYFIDGAYYRVNKIDAYDETLQDSTAVELIKVVPKVPFEPGQFTIYGNTSMSTQKFAQLPTKSSIGKNIVINTDQPVIAMGEDIVIGQGCRNVSVIGSTGVRVAEGLENVTVVNTDNIEITESNVIYNNGVLTAAWNNLYGALIRIVASSGMGFILTMDETHGTVIGDCSLNTIDCYLPDPATVCTTDIEGMKMSKIYSFTKTDVSVNALTINPDGVSGALINGSSFYSLTLPYTSVSFQTDGINWYQIAK